MAVEMDVRQMFDSNYIGAWDLQGRDVVVEIAKVTPGSLAKAGTSQKDKAPIIHFKGREKGMVVNKTNMRAIANIAGSFKAKDWIGVRVTLFPTTCTFGPNTVDCIRVRPKAPPASRQAAPEPTPPVDEREPGADDETPATEAA